eukprot:7266778-Pyramimonas_sp.AAC.1
MPFWFSLWGATKSAMPSTAREMHLRRARCRVKVAAPRTSPRRWMHFPLGRLAAERVRKTQWGFTRGRSFCRTRAETDVRARAAGLREDAD